MTHAARSLLKRQRGGIFSRLLFLLCFAFFCCLIYIVRHPLLRLAGGFWIVNDPPKPSDAIVMLSDDDYQADRAAHAAELYRAGWAPRVIASGRLLRPYAGIAELEEHDLESRGVPANAVVRLPGADRNTRQECQNIGQFVAAHGWKRILLVTSNYHTRRARYICSRVLPSGTTLIVSAARDTDYDPQTWWTTRQGMKMFFQESSGMIAAMWELRHSDVQTSDEALPFDPRSLLPH
ncbi:MAG TPA: YdcF family protein [Candidatus Acidoferrales bacterium]|nr:YdcF family protein [Candidatus Acidoferrales bacterium]